MEINRIKRKGLADVIGDQLREGILKGELSPGDRLPPERELASRFGTNRNTLREAIRALEAQGLVRARQGDGVRVLDFRETGAFDLLPQMVRLADPEQRQALFGDLLRVRRTVSGEAVVMAAERRNADQVARLRELIAEQRGHDGDLLSLVTTDVLIYRALVETSASLVATLMFNTMERVVHEFVVSFPQIIWFAPDYLDRMSEVVDAIEDGDADRARTVFGNHLRNSDKELLRRIGTG
jgi:GntR family transcriptional regulator, transcriptional repressor for pyruvate dehydrogenase complex